MAGKGWAIALLLVIFSTVLRLLLRPPAGQSSSRVPAESATVDQQVLEAVFEDLLTYTGDDSPVATRGSSPKKLLFSPRAAAVRLQVDDVLDRYQRERWDKLTEFELAGAREAAEHLVRRIGTDDLFIPFRPKDARVLIQSDADDGTGRERLNVADDRPIRAWPPGYSQGKGFCIVRLVIPWGIHHAEATYLLARRDAKWVVLLRQFVYYL
jgi:hypothetical protein